MAKREVLRLYSAAVKFCKATEEKDFGLPEIKDPKASDGHNLPEMNEPKASDNPDLYYEGLSEEQIEENKKNRDKLEDEAWSLSANGKYKEAYELWMILRDLYLDKSDKNQANDAMGNGLEDLARFTAINTWKKPLWLIQKIIPWDTYVDRRTSKFSVYLAKKEKTVDGWSYIDNIVKIINIDMVDGNPKIEITDPTYYKPY